VFVLPARLERSDEARGRLLRLADLLDSHSVEEVADLLVAEEEAEGSFDRFPASRDRRREAILAMNAQGIPRAIREVIDDPPLAARESLHRVTAPALVVGQEGDPVHRADVARELAATLPNAELILFEDRHAMLAEVAALTQRIAGFLGG
jgi:3-oxoadipate enol-lactonase